MIYFNTGWISPLSSDVLETMDSVFRTEVAVGPASLAGLRNAENWDARCRATLADLMNCDPEELRLTHGTRDGLEQVLNGVTWQPGDTLVTTNLEHAALRDECRALEKRHAIRMQIVEISENDRSGEAVTKLVESIVRAKPKLVAVSHVQYGWGLYLPMRKVIEAARHHGALVLIDGAQSVGHLPVDLNCDNADFYTVSGQKWLGGPSGTGAVFVRRSSRNALAHGHWNWESDNRYSLSGHNVALIAGLTVAVDAVMKADVAARLDHSRELELILRTELAGSPINVVAPHQGDSNGMLALRIKDVTPDRLQAWLEETHQIVVRRVAAISAIRLCITDRHSKRDIRQTAEALREAAEVLLPASRQSVT